MGGDDFGFVRLRIKRGARLRRVFAREYDYLFLKMFLLPAVCCSCRDLRRSSSIIPFPQLPPRLASGVQRSLCIQICWCFSTVFLPATRPSYLHLASGSFFQAQAASGFSTALHQVRPDDTRCPVHVMKPAMVAGRKTGAEQCPTSSRKRNSNT